MPAKTHGASRATGPLGQTYRVWLHMRERCRRPQHPEYPRYGGRGISVCERWLKFENFLEDMGVVPMSGLSIERLDNDGNYEPDNCCWATIQDQNANKTQGNQKPLLALSVRDVAKAMYADGWSTRRIAKELGVSKSLVWQVVSGVYDEAG